MRGFTRAPYTGAEFAPPRWIPRQNGPFGSREPLPKYGKHTARAAYFGGLHQGAAPTRTLPAVVNVHVTSTAPAPPAQGPHGSGRDPTGSRHNTRAAHDTVYRASGIVSGGGVLGTYVDSDQT